MSFLKTQVSFQCCISIQCHQTQPPYTFFSSNIIYFVQKKRIKVQIFEILECLGKNLSNFCQFWTSKSIPYRILHQSSLSWHKTPLKILSLSIFHFGSKDPINVTIFRLSEMLWLNFAKLLMSFLKAQVIFLFNFASIFNAIKNNPSILFLAQTLFTLVKSSLLKCKFLRFSSAQVKICQIPLVNFELKSQFLFNFCIILHCHDT